MNLQYFGKFLTPFLIICSMLLPQTASAAKTCNEPAEPYCMYNTVIYDDQAQYQKCSTKLEAFIKAQEKYTACLQTHFATERKKIVQQNQKTYDAAVSRGNEIVGRFNCLSKNDKKKCY